MDSNNKKNSERQPIIVSCALRSGLGDLKTTWTGLMERKSALHPFPIPEIPTRYPVGRVAGLDGDIGSYKRLQSLIQIGLQDIDSLAGITGHHDTIVATTKGAADELLTSPDRMSGQAWQLGEIIMELSECAGKPQIISAACASGTIALIQAGKRILSGASNVVLVVGIDLLSTFVTAGFDALKGLSPNPCRPFDRTRDGLSLGEGIGLVVVTSRHFASKNKLKEMACLAGWGISSDATHITAPCRHGSGLLRVLSMTTENKTLPVGAVHAHGTGTIYNDAMEMTAFNSFWKNPPPVHSIKGAVGHCLGAAGVIEAAISVHSLQQNCIPPTVGLQQEEFMTGKISGETPLALESPSILSCNSGFGGINAGVLLSAPG